MKRKWISAGLCLFLLLTLTACRTAFSLTFQTENGERIKVTLETGEGYGLSSKDGETLRLYVKKDDHTVLEGILLTEEGYAAYRQMLDTTDEAVILTAEPEDEPVSFAYQWEAEDGTRTDFLTPIEESDYAVLFESSASYEEAEAAFNRLSFQTDG